MSGTIWGVRELDIRYKPLRLPMPVSGNVGNPCEAARLAAAVLADVTVEKVIALHVTTKQKLIGVHVVSIGTLDASLVHPREVFKAALLANAAGLILAHYVARHIMRLMCRRSLCGRGQWKPPITQVDTLIAGT
jgi:hypothetical protein